MLTAARVAVAITFLSTTAQSTDSGGARILEQVGPAAGPKVVW